MSRGIVLLEENFRGVFIDIYFYQSEDLVAVFSSVDIAPFFLLLALVFAFGNENRLAVLISS